MSSAEFISTSPLKLDDHDSPDMEKAEPAPSARSLLKFSIRFDPYSPTAADDYETLKKEIAKFDIIGLLQAELSKSRIHIALARKIVTTIQFLAPKQRDQAVLSLIENADLLYPILSSTLTVIKHVFGDLSESTQKIVIDKLLSLLQSGSHVLRVELLLAYAIRILAQKPSAGVQEMLVKLYSSSQFGPLVRRDIILAMTRLGAWHWLSDRGNFFRGMSPAERRAFIISSFSLKDEGKHWRQHISKELTPLEKIVKDWAESKFTQPGWAVPL